ncbi:MAG: N-acetylmuramoyl-L-alanine amidase [Bacillaceae bacterium]|nr:N-acetylmuramoyl-L-alanine amidase [Bacillaceae bacterium]
MRTIMIDPGHGGSDPGAVFQSFSEKDFNLNISLLVRDYLQANYEVNVLMTRTTDTTLSLIERTNLANSRNPDFFLSIHNNAGGGTGFESYIFNGTVNNETVNFQRIIHDEIMQRVRDRYNITDRGKKRANFHVLRETRMTALLLEVLFVDNSRDLALLRNGTFVRDVSTAIAIGVARALNLPRKSIAPPVQAGLFRVIAGSFTERSNAEQRVTFLQRNNIESFILPSVISGRTYYRVQAGAYSERANAENRVNILRGLGITDAFILTENQTDSGVVPQPSPSPEPINNSLFKVFAGSFNDRSNAEKRVIFLNNNSIAAFIVATTISNRVYFRVQTGAFSERENAEQQVARLKQLGISDAFFIEERVNNSPPTSPPPTSGNENVQGVKIQGESVLNAYQLDEFVKTFNPNAPNLGQYYIKYGEIYNIKADIAYAQALHETNYFRFTGDVQRDQNNFAGLGATGSGVRGASFASPEEGVHAHIQHLFAYASTEELPQGQPLVNPRFQLVTRGIASTWIGLNGRWAVPGTTYGQSILNLYKRMLETTLTMLTKQTEEINNTMEELNNVN